MAPKSKDIEGIGCLISIGAVSICFGLGLFYGAAIGWISFGIFCIWIAAMALIT